jgi:lipopolysaccharide transport system ATP-binding protein
MSDEVLVRVDGVGKKFCRSLKKSLWYGVCDIAGELLPGRKRQRVAGSELRVAREEAEVAGSELLVASGNTSASGLVTSHSPLVTPTADHAARDEDLREGEFYAVRDVSFELRRGECLGLIGHNGAGKTTLLKMLNGLIKPDRGSITMRGRVGALIALGAGFNPILTGRENIYINGSVLGLTKKEIDEKIDEIIDFAEIREAIDMPVQNYSSGMTVRLGFAVASTLEPDILIADEVLAVGDSSFKVKCYNRIRKILPKTTVLLVSHSMFDIARVCTRVLVMDNAKSLYLGSVEKGIHIYNEINTEKEINSDTKYIIHKDSEIENVRVDSFVTNTTKLDSSINLKFSFLSGLKIGESRIRLVFFDDAEVPVAEWDSFHHNIPYAINKGENTFVVKVESIRLRSGKYRIAVVVTDPLNNGYTIGIEYGLNINIQNQALAGAPYKI